MNRREFIRNISVGIGVMSTGTVLSMSVKQKRKTPRASAFAEKRCAQNRKRMAKETQVAKEREWVKRNPPVLRNPVSLLYNLVRQHVPNISVDHEAFLKRLQECEVRLDPMCIPEGSLLDQISFLAVKSNSVVTLLNRHINQLTIRKV